MKTGHSLKLLAAAAALSLGGTAALAADVVTIRVHHPLPPASTAQARLIEPWCAKINKESAGRLKCQIYPAMQLGGTPPQLIDQVKDGVADVVWTLPGYQAGRFLVTEAFELPFITAGAEKSSRALWEYASKNAGNEFKGIKPLIFHVSDGAVWHTKSRPLKTMADFKGLKLRAPTRLATKLVTALGGTPVPMPVPQVPEAISKGVVDGALLTWEVVPSLKIQEIVSYHGESDISMPSLSNNVFLLAMNPARYDSLPAELKKVIDANSGAQASAWAGRVWEEASAPARKLAVEHKNTVYTIPASELKTWQKAAESVTADWIKEVGTKGHDGTKLLQEAKALMQ